MVMGPVVDRDLPGFQHSHVDGRRRDQNFWMHGRYLNFSGKYVDVDKLQLLLHLAVNLYDIGADRFVLVDLRLGCSDNDVDDISCIEKYKNTAGIVGKVTNHKGGVFGLVTPHFHHRFY